VELTVSYINEILVFVVFAVSLNLLLGFAGQVSVAVGAFGAIGGYSVAYLTLIDHWNFVPALIVGIVLAGVAGFLVGIPALRLTLEWLILLSLAFQTIVIGLLNALGQFGGSYGLQNIVGLTFFGLKMNTPTQILPVFIIFAVVVFLLCYRMGMSPYGRVLRSIREDELASRSLGKNIFTYKLAVFAITSAMAAVAGAMLTVENQLASPALFGFTQSAAIVVMVIFGGMGNLWGSVLGATLLVLSDPFLRHVVKLQANTASLWQLTIYGLLLVVVMFVRPQGILPEGASLRRWLASRRRTQTPEQRELSRVAPLGMDTNVGAVSEEEVEREDVATLADLRAHHAAPAEVADLAAARIAHRGEVVLEVRGLTKAFGGIHAAEDLDMDFHRGTITALVGPNGAGKTTVFNLLTGAIRPDRGKVVLNGRDVTNMSPNRVAKLGMVRSFQDVRVFARLTSLENVMLGVQAQSGEHLSRLFLSPRGTARDESATREKAREWLAFVGMTAFAEVPASALSFGQQKLVALARVLATEAEVVLLDEPASGIDQQWVDAMLGRIEELRAQGRTVCIVEHNLAVVGRLADHTYFMELGRITAEGSFADLVDEPRLAEAYFGTG
jgi:branched-chain amino acid transport system permease protein